MSQARKREQLLKASEWLSCSYYFGSCLIPEVAVPNEKRSVSSCAPAQLSSLDNASAPKRLGLTEAVELCLGLPAAHVGCGCSLLVCVSIKDIYYCFLKY